MGLYEAFNSDVKASQLDEHKETEASEKDAMRSHFFHRVGGIVKDSLKAMSPPDLGEAMTEEGKATPGAIKDFAEGQLKGGVGGRFARNMMGTDEQAPEQKQFLESQPFYRIGGEAAQYAAGAAEWIGWGKVAGIVGKGFAPITRFLPEGLRVPFTAALTGGAINTAATGTVNEMQGRPVVNEIPSSFAVGVLLGGAGGLLSHEDAAAGFANYDALKGAAGSSYEATVKNMQTVSGNIAKEERLSPKDTFQRLIKFAQGHDDEVLAAKVRMAARANPEHFKDGTMKRVLDRATGSEKPAFTVPKRGEVKDFFANLKQTGETVKREGGTTEGKRGPLGMPLEPTVKSSGLPQDKKWMEGYINDILNDKPKIGQDFKPSTKIASRTLTEGVMAGSIKPEHIQRGDQASVIARGIFKVGREEEKAGRPFSHYMDKGKEWQRRVRELDGEPSMPEGKVDASSAVELNQLREAVNKGQPKEAIGSGPVKRQMTKAIEGRKRDAKGRFC